MSEINIECPECRERFLVSPELMGETVECGGCEHNFEVSDQHIKTHPMRHNPRTGSKGLDGFTRSTPEIERDEKASVRTTAYHQQVDVSSVMPLGPMRIFSIAVGLAVSALVILIFVLGGGELGILKDIPNEKRWILAGFIALLTALLVIWGFRKHRALGVVISIISSVTLLMMPVFYPQYEAEIQERSQNDDVVAISDAEKLEVYKNELGYHSIQDKITKSSDPKQVVAIVLKGAKPVHLETIKTYLSQSLDSVNYPNVYKERRVDGEDIILLVYTRVMIPIEQMARHTEKFGKGTTILEELRIIEVEVDTEALTSNNAAELTDVTHPAFYKANLEELKNIDRSRQLSAIQRLSLCESLSSRADIENQLLVLLQEKNHPHRAEIINTLVKWSGNDGKAAQIIYSQSLELIAKKKKIPQSTLDYCVKYDFPESAEILVYAWKKDRVVHEETLILAGPKAERALLLELEKLEPILLESAANVLRKIGSEKSLQALLTLHESSAGSVKKSLKATIDEIKSRR